VIEKKASVRVGVLCNFVHYPRAYKGDLGMVLTRGTQSFKKSRSNLQIIGIWKVTCSRALFSS